MSDRNSDNRTIYIGNMPYTAKEEELRWLVDPRKVARITIPTDKETNRPRGFGFIEFENEEDALSAVKDLDGKEFGGRTIKVNISKPRTNGDGRRDNRRDDRRDRERR